MYNRIRGTFFLLTLTFLLTFNAKAQTAETGTLSKPDLSAFPRIEAYLDLKDESGRFIHGLKPGEVSFFENGNLLPALELQELRPGAQFVLVINPGPPFALRNVQGVSRFEIIQDTLRSWAASRIGSTLDDLSLLFTNGQQITHVNDPDRWADSLVIDTINPRQSTPSLDVLLQAIETAAETTPRPGMGRAVLFISPPIEEQTDVAVDNIIGRARQAGVSISIWMVPVPNAYYPVAETQFNKITSQTGGRFYTFTDEQPTIDLDSLLEPYRQVYKAAYLSQIRTSGSHQLAAEAQTPGGSIATQTQTFELDLQAPQPAFVTPPLDVRRKPPVDEEGQVIEDAAPESYLPSEQEIQVLVAFPDERMRSLARTSLYIDGELVQENRRAPFENFTWDLSPYSADGMHTLRVEAEDNLGLVGTSIERLVQVTIEKPVWSPWSWVNQNAVLLAVLGAIIAGAVLILVLVLGGRLRPRIPVTSRASRRRSDPVTQPVPIKVEPPSRRLTGWVKGIHWPQRAIPPKADAFLNRITDVDSGETTAPIPIMGNEITIGCDPDLASLVVNDPSVEGLHARIVQEEGGAYRISDQGSIAGTWVNYTPVSREGVLLEHGDLVHLGRVGFRFTLRQVSATRKAVILPADEEESPVK